MTSVVIIGSGNVATHLAKGFFAAGVRIEAVYSPQLKNAQALAQQVGSMAIHQLSAVPPVADLYVIAVKDAAVHEVSNQLEVKGMVVHTSGITPMSVLATHEVYGVCYPLQSFNKQLDVSLQDVPFLLEAHNDSSLKQLEQWTRLLSPKLVHAHSHQRQMVHLAAVFANNFTNHLYQVAFDIVEKNNLSVDLLKPLITETARKVQTNKPVEVQTGPARRNDIPTIEQHLTLLRNHPEYRQLYEILSTEIRKQFATVKEE